MEFLRIGDSKIKIVLNADEPKKYGITVGDDGCSSSNRRAVWEILELARAQVDFDPDGDKILVQFYPLPSGGCEIFVTKLGILAPSSARSVARSERVTLISRMRKYFLFSSFFDVKRALCAIASSELSERKLTLLKGESTYILAIDEINDGELGELSVLREFSSPTNEDTFIYAAEHFDTVYNDIPIKDVK